MMQKTQTLILERHDGVLFQESEKGLYRRFLGWGNWHKTES